MFHSLLFPGFRRIILLVFACCLSVSGSRLSAQTPAPPQDAPSKTDSTETPETRTASAVASTDAEGSSSSADAAVGKAVVLPQRFVSMVFDDVHLSMTDAAFVRDSATRFFEALAASDRVSLNSTSGQLTQEFTDDHNKLAEA